MALVTIDDKSFKSCELSKELKRLRKDYFRAVPEICIERPKLLTQFSLEAGLFEQDKISILDKARVFRNIL